MKDGRPAAGESGSGSGDLSIWLGWERRRKQLEVKVTQTSFGLRRFFEKKAYIVRRLDKAPMPKRLADATMPMHDAHDSPPD